MCPRWFGAALAFTASACVGCTLLAPSDEELTGNASAHPDAGEDATGEGGDGAIVCVGFDASCSGDPVCCGAPNLSCQNGSCASCLGAGSGCGSGSSPCCPGLSCGRRGGSAMVCR